MACPPGTYPRIVRVDSKRRIVCAPGLVTPFGGPASGLWPLGGRVGPEAVLASCLTFVFNRAFNTANWVFDVRIACSPLLPGQCATVEFAMGAPEVLGAIQNYRFRVQPVILPLVGVPTIPFLFGSNFVLTHADTILGARYVMISDGINRTVNMTKNGVQVGSLVTSGQFVNGPNVIGAPAQQINPSVMFPGQCAYLHGAQVAEFNSVGALVANRLRQINETPVPCATSISNITGDLVFCNRTTFEISVGTKIGEFQVVGRPDLFTFG